MRARKEPQERGIEKVGEILARGWGVSDERHPLVRVGECREAIPLYVRTAVWYRDHGRCEHCGESVQGQWEMDHIYPWSRGRPTIPTNGQALCGDHNRRKGAMRPPWWYVLSLERRRRRYFPPDEDVQVDGKISAGELAQHTAAPKHGVRR